ncbi:MAG: lipoprotein [Francisella sp.]
MLKDLSYLTISFILTGCADYYNRDNWWNKYHKNTRNYMYTKFIEVHNRDNSLDFKFSPHKVIVNNK